MIACICISKLAPGHYGVHVDDVDGGVAYETIAEAIADNSDLTSDYAKFVNIEYHGVRLSTMRVVEMRLRSHELADELVRMSAEIHASNI